MNDEFATKIHPTILYVLDLLDRIHNGRGKPPDPKSEAPRLKQYLGQLDVRGRDEKDYELAKCALVYWIDEVLINSPWPYANQWKDQTLEWDLLGTNDRAWLFYEKANVAKSLGRADALETFYLCVSLGFVGIYRGGEAPTGKGAKGEGPAPAKPKKPQREMISWFDETPPPPGPAAPGPAPSQGAETWGLEEAPAPAPPGQTAPPESGRTITRARKGPAGSSQELPPTLLEWAKAVKSQISGGLRSFQPSEACDSQRVARPLMGIMALQRTAAMTLGMGLICAILLAVWMWG